MQRDMYYEILTLCQKESPTGTEQEAFVDLCHELQREHGYDSKQVSVGLIDALWEGINNNNWPKRLHKVS